MATPELIIANAPYKTYPGGVVAVRCADWLAAARGTLSTETDTLSSAGGLVVRDTQQVSNILSAGATAYAAADDTLEITGLPLKDLRRYEVWATFKVECEMDYTDGAVLRASFQEDWVGAGLIGMHSSTDGESFNRGFDVSAVPPPLPYFRAVQIAGELQFHTGDTWYLRMAAKTGSSIEIILDQLVIFPDAGFLDATHYPQASGATVFLDADTQDGLDGGDDNSKFTWFANRPVDNFTSRGDYQQYADGDSAEYFTQITVPDGMTVWFSPFGEEQGNPWIYSLHTAMYRGPITWMDDTFDNRDTSDQTTYPNGSYGISPDGFGASMGGSFGPPPGSRVYCDGAGSLYVENNTFLGLWQMDVGSGSTGTSDLVNQGMKLKLYDQWSWDMILEWADGQPGLHFDPLLGNLQIAAFHSTPVNSPIIHINLGSPAEWYISDDGTGSPGAAHDISSWWDVGASMGIRIEQKRHLFRMRLWDASGAEPSTWDHEFFLYDSTHGDPYPYSDDENRQAQMAAASVQDLQVRCEITDNDFFEFPLTFRFTKFTVEHDPYGSPVDMNVRMERPPGTEIGDQVVPYGTSYWVYWGKRDWTDDDGTGDSYFAWSTKVWNDPGAAEIQRAEVGDYYIFWFESGGLVAMNWSSEEQAEIYRIHDLSDLPGS